MTERSADKKPVLACFSGNDPSGGAGIQADIESCLALGVHSLPLITLNTVQDSQGIRLLEATDCTLLEQQFACLQEDMPIAGIKIGMLANEAQLSSIASIIDNSALPTIVDTVFSSGLGSARHSPTYIEHFCGTLLQRALVVTPNIVEAKAMARVFSDQNLEGAEEVAKVLMDAGCRHLVITGGHSDNSEHMDSKLQSVLFFHGEHGKLEHFTHQTERLPHSFHGSGCTFASSLAAHYLLGKTLQHAFVAASDFTYASLVKARPLGQHQYFPERKHS